MIRAYPCVAICTNKASITALFKAGFTLQALHRHRHSWASIAGMSCKVQGLMRQTQAMLELVVLLPLVQQWAARGVLTGG